MFHVLITVHVSDPNSTVLIEIKVLICSTTRKIQRKGSKGRPRIQWIDNTNKVIEPIGLILRGAMDLTKNRGKWK